MYNEETCGVEVEKSSYVGNQRVVGNLREIRSQCGAELENKFLKSMLRQRVNHQVNPVILRHRRKREYGESGVEGKHGSQRGYH